MQQVNGNQVVMGYKTIYTYDVFGHKIFRAHPDAGITTRKYDLAGNIISQQTANQKLMGTDSRWA